MTERLPQFAVDAANRRRHPNDQVVEEAIRKRNTLSAIDDIIDKSQPTSPSSSSDQALGRAHIAMRDPLIPVTLGALSSDHSDD